jgi:hypothetical protein
MERLKGIHSRLIHEEVELLASIRQKKAKLNEIGLKQPEDIEKENHLPVITTIKPGRNTHFHKRTFSLHESLAKIENPYLTSQENIRKKEGLSSIKEDNQYTIDDPIQSEKLLPLLLKIHSTLQTSLKTDLTFTELLKLLEAKFEQIFLENKTIKARFPELYNRFLRDFNISQKKDPILVQAFLKTLEARGRMKKTIEQLKFTDQTKLLRRTMTKRNFSLKSIVKIGGLFNEVFSDEQYFME